MNEKIAILTDSGTDTYDIKHQNLFQLPLRITVDDQENTSLSPQEVYAMLDDHAVKTSLPSPKEIMETIETVKAQGYSHVIAITISSALSGTYNIIRNLLEEEESLVSTVIDTKNISFASGFSVVDALTAIDAGQSYQEIVKMLEASLDNKKVFFTVATLHYLQQGGRIGLVSGAVGTLLDIKPIITCNQDGIYESVRKVRNYKRSIQTCIQMAAEFVANRPCDVALVYASDPRYANEYEGATKEALPTLKSFRHVAISLALGVHTGSEAFGVVVSIKN